MRLVGLKLRLVSVTTSPFPGTPPHARTVEGAKASMEGGFRMCADVMLSCGGRDVLVPAGVAA
jgi:hypothetical protein